MDTLNLSSSRINTMLEVGDCVWISFQDGTIIPVLTKVLFISFSLIFFFFIFS